MKTAFLLVIMVVGTSCGSVLLPSGRAAEDTTLPVGPVASHWDSAHNTLTLGWDPVNKALGYEVQQQIGSSEWTTLFNDAPATKITFPLPSFVQKEIYPKPTKVTLQWRIRAKLPETVSSYSSPVVQEMSLDYSVLPVDGTKKYKVVDDGEFYRVEMRIKNDSNVTIRHMTFIMSLYDSPPWFDGGTGAYSHDLRAGFEESVAPGGTGVVRASVAKIAGFDFTTAYMMTTPLVDVN